MAAALDPAGTNLYVAAFVSGAMDVLDRNLRSGVVTQKPGERGCLAPATVERIRQAVRELGYVPFYGWYLFRAGMIPVSREGGAQALRRMTEMARQRFADGRSIVIFPEGTRKKAHAPPDYKPGVAALYGQLDVPCVPVALNSGLFWTGPVGFLKKPGRVVVEFLEPIPPGLKRRDFMLREARVPAARMGRPLEIASLITYLCSEPAGYLTGSWIEVDGGLHRSAF